MFLHNSLQLNNKSFLLLISVFRLVLYAVSIGFCVLFATCWLLFYLSNNIISLTRSCTNNKDIKSKYQIHYYRIHIYYLEDNIITIVVIYNPDTICWT